jgi:hypothetical protein
MVRVEFSQRLVQSRRPSRWLLPARRRQPQIRARLLAGLDARADQDLQRLRLLERVDRVVADPHEFEPRLVHAFVDYVVERVLHPRFQWHEPFLRRLLPHGFASRAVDLAHERRNGHREGVAAALANLLIYYYVKDPTSSINAG